MQAPMTTKEMAAILRQNLNRTQMEGILEDFMPDLKETADLAAIIADGIDQGYLPSEIIAKSYRPDLTDQDWQFLHGERKRQKQLAVALLDELLGTRYEDLYCAQIVVLGEAEYDVYDEHPGLAYYEKRESRSLDVPVLTSAEAVKKFAIEFFESHLEAAGSESFDGRFIPSTMHIKNMTDQTIALYEGNDWFTDVLNEASIIEAEIKIGDLKQQASEERSWDNFDTARRIDNTRARLQLIVELSKYHASAPLAA